MAKEMSMLKFNNWSTGQEGTIQASRSIGGTEEGKNRVDAKEKKTKLRQTPAEGENVKRFDFG